MFIKVRLRLLILVLAALIPSMLLIGYLNVSERRASEQAQLEKLQVVAKLYAAEHAQVMENSRHLLIALANTPSVLVYGDQCNEYLQVLMQNYQRYDNFGVADTGGRVVCSAVSPRPESYINQTRFFQEAIKTKELAVGEYRLSQLTGNPVLSFGYPLKNNRDQIIGVIYASIDLSWLNELVESLVEETALVAILDKNQKILAINRPKAQLAGEVFVKENNVVYVFEPIGVLSEGLSVAVGQSRDSIYRPALIHFQERLILAIGLSLVSIFLAWQIGGVLIVRQVKVLEQLDCLKDDFIALVSHQIRTPVTGIKWLSEIILKNPAYRVGNKPKSLVKDIHSAAERIIAMASLLLDIARFESGKIQPALEKTNLVSLVRAAARELKTKAETKNISIILTAKIKHLTVRLDQKLIKQVMYILLDNAVKYSPSGSIVRVAVKRQPDGVKISVADSGIGIDVSDQQQMFSKFFRGKNAQELSPQGSGLGLYFCRLIILAHHGRIWFTGRKHQGTEFNFILPENLKMV